MQDTVKVTKKCEGCRNGMHLVMDISGSAWVHDRLVDEYECFRAYRALYSDGTIDLGPGWE